MLPQFWQRLDQSARSLLPFIITVLFALAGVVAWPLPYVAAVAPSFVLISIYYWAIHRPDLFGPGAACLIGILYDAINGLPLGLSALVFVAIYQLVLSQRRFFAGGFSMLWAGFAISMVIAMITHWLALTLFNWHWVTIVPILLQSLLTIVIFPLPAWVLIQVQRITFNPG